MSRIFKSLMFSVAGLIVLSPLSMVNASSGECYTIATWNLENYSFSKKRGFPEYNNGGPKYGPRTERQRNAVAMAIQDRIGTKIVVLNEIDGRKSENGKLVLEDLVERLGDSWKFRIGTEGSRGSQRIALVWDSRFAKLSAYKEIKIKKKKVDSKDIFDKDPLLGYFTLLKNGKSMNDLLVVGLHLASGQNKMRNHDAAMKRLREELKNLRDINSVVLPKLEADIIIAGDLNANAFDEHKEEFFNEFNRGNWRVLAEDGSYPATRLKGVPLGYGDPIDYILATSKSDEFGGLAGEEVLETTAKVWTELIVNDEFGKFREVYSDHLPVSVCVRVMADTD